jgi:hypothetical protein
VDLVTHLALLRLGIAFHFEAWYTFG